MKGRREWEGLDLEGRRTLRRGIRGWRERGPDPARKRRNSKILHKPFIRTKNRTFFSGNFSENMLENNLTDSNATIIALHIHQHQVDIPCP
jgi:hypothetical protein